MEDGKKRVIKRKSGVSYTFGDIEEKQTIKSVEIPARIVGNCTSIKAEVVRKKKTLFSKLWKMLKLI